MLTSEMPTANFTDADINYETTGEGEPQVLIPGFASGAWSWQWQVGPLSDHLRVITFDPRGVSRSVLRDGAAVSIKAIADDIAALLELIGVESAYVLGISFGGFVAQEFAIRYPECVKKLVLASTSFGGPNHVLPSVETLASFASTTGLNSANRIRRNLAIAFSNEFLKTNALDVERFCDLREMNPVSEEVYRQQLLSAMSFNAEERLSGILCETLVLSGDRDEIVPFQNSVNLAARLPNASLAVIEGAGHMAFIERADEFNGVVKDFLVKS